ncbi:MAG TPA: hypothetical protein VNL77_02635 [Roseiflexaceae bacterium]|nr:hypothetical protein [Roseiflexaceae bacterium]
MITTLPERIAALPAPARAACERLFFVARVRGRTAIPPEMDDWVRRRFGAPEAVREQTIVRTVNRLTLEAALFNPLRALRPVGEAATDEQLEAWVAAELAGHDAFADPLRETTADLFGRIMGRHSVSASNVAKYDGWHGLVVFGEPHPLRFGREQLADYLDVALRWVQAAHAHDPAAIYPMITWNCLPKSGATIVHGHMQVSLAHGMHYARPELWRRAAEHYRAETGADYFADLFAVHRELGLALRDEPGLRAFVHLTPLRNREIVFLATKVPTGPERGAGSATDAIEARTLPPSVFSVDSVAETLAGPLYEVLRGLIDGHGVRAFNLGLALPPLAPTAENWAGVPAVARVADRGAALTTRNDWGAMELYASGSITADPFEVAQQL